MSSAYRAICLSHDPAIVVFGEDDELEWSSRADAIAAVHRRSGELRRHEDCDIVIGRYSYPLVGVICPANCGPESMGKANRTERPCWHNIDDEIDADWLRLMVAALAEPNPKTDAAIEKFSGLCWRPNRVNRLRFLLNPM